MKIVNIVLLQITVSNTLKRSNIPTYENKKSYTRVEPSPFKNLFKFSDLLRPSHKMNNTYCEGFIYCLEEDVDKALVLLKDYVIHRTTESLNELREGVVRLEKGLDTIFNAKLEDFITK